MWEVCAVIFPAQANARVSDHRAAPIWPPELFSRALHNFAAGAPPNRDWLLSVPLSDLRRTVRQPRRRADGGHGVRRRLRTNGASPFRVRKLHAAY
jgi:hypothetical protein